MTDPPSTARTSQAQRPGGAAPQSDNHVFVSYAREDKAFVTALRDFLASESREVWVDWEGIPASAEWFAEIERAIAAADAVVFVLSPDFADSETCAKEAELAVQYNKKIIPVVHRDVTPDRQPEQVRARQWIFARDEEESKAGFASLRHALDTDLEWVREHARLLNRALAWDASGSSRSSLLRGDELDQAEHWLESAASHETQPTSLHTAFLVASRREATRRQRVMLVSITIALAVSAALAVWAVLEREAKEGQRVVAVLEAWNARLNTSKTLYEQSFRLADQGRYQAASAVLLRALEVAPKGEAPPEFAASATRPDWAEEAWTRYRYLTPKRGRLSGRLVGHSDVVSALAVSGDGQRALSGSFDGSVRVWDLESLEVLHVLEGHEDRVSAVFFEPGDRKAFSAGADGSLVGWDVEAGQLLAQISDLPTAVTAVARGFDGRLAIGLQDGLVSVQTVDGEFMFGHRMFSRSVTALGFSDDGESLFGGSARPTIGGTLADGAATVVELATGREATVIHGTLEGSPTSMALDPVAERGLRGLDNGIVDVWDLSARELKQQLTGHTAAVRSLAIGPDGKTAASGSDDNTIRLWDLDAAKLTRVLDGHLEPISVLTFTPDGARLLSGSFDGTIGVWQLQTAAEKATVDAASVGAVAISSNNVVAASLGEGGNIRLWELDSASSLGELASVASSTSAVALSPDGERALVGQEDGSLALWDTRSGHRLRLLEGHEAVVSAIAFFPQGNAAVSGDTDGKVSVWDLGSGDVTHVFQVATGIAEVRVTPDSTRILARADGGTLSIWDLATKALLAERQGIAGFDVVPDGGSILVGSGSGALSLLDLETGAETAGPTGHAAGVTSVTVVAPGVAATGSDDRTIRVSHLETGAQRVLRGHAASVSKVALGPDGHFAVSADRGGHVLVWELSVGEVIADLGGGTKTPKRIAVSRDGSTLITAAIGEPAQVWDLVRFVHRAGLQVGHTDEVHALAFDADGRLLATGSDDATIRIWDVETREQVWRRTANAPVTGLAWQGDRLITTSGNREALLRNTMAFGAAGGLAARSDPGRGSALVWDRDTGRVAALRGHVGPVRSVAYALDGQAIISVSDDGTARVWDVATGRHLRALQGHRDAIWSLAVSPDGKTAATGSIDSSIHIWDLMTGDTVRVIDEHTGGVGSMAFADEGRLLVSASADATVRTFAVDSGEEQARFSHDDGLTAVALHPSREEILIGALDPTLRQWSFRDDRSAVRTLTGHSDSVWSVAIDRGGRWAASASNDGTLRVWDLDAGESVHALSGDSMPLGVALSPDGLIAASGHDDGTTQLWDIATGERSAVLEANAGSVVAVAFHPEGELLASGHQDGSVRIWNADTHELVRVVGVLTGAFDVAAHPDETHALIGYQDGSLRLWHVASSEEIAVLKEHDAPVTSVAIAPSGALAISGSMDGTLRTWDMETLEEAGVISGHSSPVLDVAFAPDGLAALSASSDGTVRVWDVKTGRELRRLSGELPRRVDLPAMSASGLVLELTLPSGDVPTTLAVAPDGNQALVGSSTSQFLWSWRLVEPDVASMPPTLTATDQPFENFDSHYDAVGLHVSRHWSDAGMLKLWDVGGGDDVPVLAGDDGDDGESTLDEGRLEDIISIYRRTLGLAGESDHAQQLPLLVSRIAHAYLRKGDLQGGLLALERGLAMNLELAARDPQDLASQRAVYLSEFELGVVRERVGDLAAAATLYGSALERNARLVALYPTNDRLLAEKGELERRVAEVAGAQ